MIDGWIIVDKESGVTSMDICRRIRANYKNKVGHAGTLDPLATGIMIIGMGKALKLIEFVHMLKKRYVFTVTWGIHTDTYDITGKIIEENNIRNKNYMNNLNKFVGTITQKPPIFSAIKIHGVPAYKIARASGNVEITERKVSIYSINIISSDENSATFDVTCSKGTYIRSLAVDIALSSNMLGTVSSIRRIEYGPFSEINVSNEILSTESVLEFEKIYFDINQARKFITGHAVNYKSQQDVLYTIVYFNTLLGIGKGDNKGYIRPIKVITTQNI